MQNEADNSPADGSKSDQPRQCGDQVKEPAATNDPGTGEAPATDKKEAATWERRLPAGIDHNDPGTGQSTDAAEHDPGTGGEEPDAAERDSQCQTDEEPPSDDTEEDPYADAPIVSAKVEHDFVPCSDNSSPELASTSEDGSLSQTNKSMLVPCPRCGTDLEPWQLACHQCGSIVSKQIAPTVVADKRDEERALASFSDWFKNGSAALEAGDYSSAQISFAEALTRVKGQENNHDREVLVRKQLARALEKLEKRAEASEQYVILSKLTAHSRDEFEKRASALSRSTADMMARVLAGVHYRNPEGKETRLVPLYCSRCRMLLVEAEVYGFRNGKNENVRCFCGYEGRPLVRVDAKHLRALKEAPLMKSQRARLLQAAAGVLPGAHKKDTAMALALLLGWCGAHRFYLGERAGGIPYIVWLLTLFCLSVWWQMHGWFVPVWIGLIIPFSVALFDAISYAQMSRVTFNLTYNIERVLAELPADEQAPALHTEVFSMEPGEQPIASEDGFSDQFSAGDSAAAAAPNVIPGTVDGAASVNHCDPT